jgi:hypothetical protein
MVALMMPAQPNAQLKGLLEGQLGQLRASNLDTLLDRPVRQKSNAMMDVQLGTRAHPTASQTTI